MGQFRVTITAVGGHGCQRNIKDGETVASPCGNPSCPDCIARATVAQLRETGTNVDAATLEHWPGTESQVTDNLITGVRTGNF